MQRFDSPRPTPEPTEPRVAFSQKPKMLLKLVLFAILALLLVSSLVYGAYWYGKRQVPPPTPEVPEATPPAESNETAGWETCEESGFLLKYPSEWSYSQNEFKDRNGDKIAELSPGHLTLVDPATCSEVFDMALKGEGSIKAKETTLGSPGGRLPELVSRKSLSLSGGDWELLVTKTFYEGGWRSSTGWVGTWYPNNFCTLKGNRMFLITFYEDSASSPNLELFKAIVSTFRFLDQEATDETAGWKTYSNAIYGFEFKYPQNFGKTEGDTQYFLNQTPAIELKSEGFNYLTSQINAFFNVSVKNDAKAECEYIPRGAADIVKNKVINGVNFTEFSTEGAATGNSYSNTIFNYLKDSTCYEIVATIHEASDGNHPETQTKINEQKVALENQLNQILSTFRFLE